MMHLKFLPVMSVLALLSPWTSASILESFPTPEPVAACEFYLGGTADSASAQKWLSDRISSLREGVDVNVSSDLPAPQAFAVLGLPKNLPESLRMRLIPPEEGQNIYRLVVTGAEGTLAEYAFELPPIYVWKNINDFDAPLFLRADVHSEDMREIGVGTIIREFEHGRIFISVHMDKAIERIEVAVGLDVDPEEMLRYTRNSTPKTILREHREGFHRIEVLKASFPIPGEPLKLTIRPVAYFSR